MQYDRKEDYNEDYRHEPTEIMDGEEETLDMYYDHLDDADLAEKAHATITKLCEALSYGRKYARGKEEKKGFREIEDHVHGIRTATRLRWVEEVEDMLFPWPRLSKMARRLLYTWAKDVCPISLAVAEDYDTLASNDGQKLSFLQIESRTRRGFFPWLLQSNPFLHIAKVVKDYRSGPPR